MNRCVRLFIFALVLAHVMLCFFCANICLSVWFEKWSKWKKWREKRNKRSVFVLSPAIFVYFYLICLVSVLCEAHKIRATQPHNICVEFSKLCAPNKKSNKLYWARCVCLAPAIVFLVLLLIVIQLRFFSLSHCILAHWKAVWANTYFKWFNCSRIYFKTKTKYRCLPMANAMNRREKKSKKETTMKR